MKKTLIVIIILILLGIISYFIFFGFSAGPQEVKINSIDITNVYRNCEKNDADNYIDTTIQTTINVDVTTTNKYSLPVVGKNCILKIGPDEVKGFALNKIPVPQPYKEGIVDSGLHIVTGGELRGDSSDIITFCCQNKCDTANLEICP